MTKKLKLLAFVILLILMMVSSYYCSLAPSGTVTRTYEYSITREDGTVATYTETITYPDSEIEEEDAPGIFKVEENIDNDEKPIQ